MEINVSKASKYINNIILYSTVIFLLFIVVVFLENLHQINKISGQDLCFTNQCFGNFFDNNKNIFSLFTIFLLV